MSTVSLSNTNHIFISYCHADGDYTRKLARALETAGFIVWIDERIDYGSRWPHAIQESLDACAAFIVVMTPVAYKSKWVQNELSRALRKDKPIFPLLLDGGEPWLSVEAIQYTDVQDGNLPPQKFYKRLADVVDIRLLSDLEIKQIATQTDIPQKNVSHLRTKPIQQSQTHKTKDETVEENLLKRSKLLQAPASIFVSAIQLKPPLKWAGGKRWLVPHLRPIWEAFQDRRYVEPFCGGLALPLAFMPENALLNDTNPHLINFYRQLQDGLRSRIDMRNDKELYYQHREGFNQQVRDGKHDNPQAASRFYYLNRTGYNGLCRFNRKGEFNVPFGSYKTIHYIEDFYEYRQPLSRWTFTASDFQDIQLQPDDFVYADPPYDVQFVSYSKNGFNWDNQVRLAEWLADHKGPVVLSNQATERVIDLYRKLNYTLIFLDAPRRISCNGNRTPAKEVLAIRGI